MHTTDCHDTCQHCHDVCLQAIAHCLRQGGAHAEEAHLRLLMDCAEICQTSAHFLLRESELHAVTCRACAEICERCAEDCERFGADDEQMRPCAEACRACAESCRAMSGQPGHSDDDGAHEHASTAERDGEASLFPTSEAIAALAGQLHEEAGCPDDRDQEFWYEAERRLRARTGESDAQLELLAGPRN